MMKNILVTGCSRGIGFEVVKGLAKDPRISVLAISRDDKGLNRLIEECQLINANFHLHTLSIDLATDKAIEKISDYVKINLNSSLDGVIHNAGYLVKKAFTDITHKELEDSFKVNCIAPFFLTQKLTPYLNKTAHVLFISSMGGVQGSKKFPGLSAYSTSKATLITMTECLVEEFKMTDIKFNCLALGAVQTEMLSRAFPGYEAPLSASQMGAYVIDFYINARKYFNGQVIPISLTTP